MKAVFQRFMLFFIGLIYFPVVFADEGNWGGVSETATDIVHVLGRFLAACSLAIGFGMTLSAILKYKYHRENPSAIPLSIPILHFLFGLMLILLGVFYIYTSPYVFGPEGGKLTVLDGVLLNS